MAKKKASESGAAAIACRVLTDVFVGPIQYRGNDVVVLEPALADAFAELGAVDADPGAVAYCTDELKVAPRDHAAEVAALEASAAAEQAASEQG